MSKIHPELSAVTVNAEPRDTLNQPYVPTTARYRVDDCRSNNQLVNWTDLTPSTDMEINIPGPVNAIIGDRRTPEIKIVTVNTDKDLSTENFAEYSYGVRDLKFAQVT
jgi:hypothetical protein